jgi:hypothetical protein
MKRFIAAAALVAFDETLLPHIDKDPLKQVPTRPRLRPGDGSQ